MLQTSLESPSCRYSYLLSGRWVIPWISWMTSPSLTGCMGSSTTSDLLSHTLVQCSLVKLSASVSRQTYVRRSTTCSGLYTASLQRKVICETRRRKKIEDTDSSSQKPISELRSVACHMRSHGVTCHPTQVNAPHPSQAGWYSIYLPRRDNRLSWPWWLVIHRDGLPVGRQSLIQVVNKPSVSHYVHQDEHVNPYTTPPCIVFNSEKNLTRFHITMNTVNVNDKNKITTTVQSVFKVTRSKHIDKKNTKTRSVKIRQCNNEERLRITSVDVWQSTSCWHVWTYSTWLAAGDCCRVRCHSAAGKLCQTTAANTPRHSSCAASPASRRLWLTADHAWRLTDHPVQSAPNCTHSLTQPLTFTHSFRHICSFNCWQNTIYLIGLSPFPKCIITRRLPVPVSAK